MGQYFVICNLDRREFLDPFAFGHGGKLAGIGRGPDGASAGLAILLAVSGTAFHTGGPIYGRWAGQRIAMVGDYFEGRVADLAWPEDYYSVVKDQEDGWVDITEHVIAVLRQDWELNLPPWEEASRSRLQPDGIITAIPVPAHLIDEDDEPAFG